jgi:formylglycine-generating enzyme required for sulfatase activity
MVETRAKAEAERRELPKKLQATTAGAQVNLLITDALAQAFALIPAGSFTMGRHSGEDGRSREESQVEVSLSQPFWLAKTEVTEAQWEAVMGSNPSEFKGPNLPVENVSWEDAQAYLTKLNEKGVLPDGWKFALPTEAQWEYACLAGEKGPFSGGSLDEVGWYNGNSGSKTHDVSQKKPNAWGLHDMHGNVWEWCSDWYDGTLRGGVDPTGPSSGKYRVERGGCWLADASSCRAAFRFLGRPGFRFTGLGFRPALVPSR